MDCCSKIDFALFRTSCKISSSFGSNLVPKSINFGANFDPKSTSKTDFVFWRHFRRQSLPKCLPNEAQNAWSELVHSTLGPLRPHQAECLVPKIPSQSLKTLILTSYGGQLDLIFSLCKLLCHHCGGNFVGLPQCTPLQRSSLITTYWSVHNLVRLFIVHDSIVKDTDNHQHTPTQNHTRTHITEATSQLLWISHNWRICMCNSHLPSPTWRIRMCNSHLPSPTWRLTWPMPPISQTDIHTHKTQTPTHTATSQLLEQVRTDGPAFAMHPDQVGRDGWFALCPPFHKKTSTHNNTHTH